MSGYRTRLRWSQRKQCLPDKIPTAVASWLYDPSSLTARLIQACEGRFRVEVLSVERTTPTPDEIRALGLRHRSRALIRQVLLYCDDVPWVYARTVIPMTSLRGPLRGISRLGSKPLGAVLFADKTMQRSEMEVAELSPEHLCYAWTGHQGTDPIYGRRSVFRLKRKPLLVSEFFLPALF